MVDYLNETVNISLNSEDIYTNREQMVEDDSLSSAKEAFMKGWEDTMEEE